MAKAFLLLAAAGVLAGGAFAQAPADRQPTVTVQTRPYYPYESKISGIEGTVLIDLVVGVDGSVFRARALSYPDPFLRDAAVAAVYNWKFRPGIKNGYPVATHLQVPIVFALGADAAKPENARPAEPPLVPPPVAQDADGDEGTPEREDIDQARSLADGGNLEGAAARLTLSITAHPEFVEAYLLRAVVFARKGYVEEARDDLDAARMIEPGLASVPDALKALPRPEPRTAGKAPWSEQRYQSFKLVWDTVDRAYYDSTFGGVDWPAMRWKYRERLPSVQTNEELRRILTEMLGELHRSHFAILPRSTAVFNPSERTRIGSAGAHVEAADGRIAIASVDAGSPAAQAGLAPGDTVVAVDAIKVDPLLAQLAASGYGGTRAANYVTDYVDSRLNGAEGAAVKLELENLAGERRTTTLVCGPAQGEWSEPYGHFPSYPIRFTAKRDDDGVARIAFNVFALPAMRRFRAFVGQLKRGDGLIIDLRGNAGGVTSIASGMCGYLIETKGSLGTLTMREGRASLDYHVEPAVFSGPIAVLIDGHSASTSEILAAGLRDLHRARLFGERSAGAALPSVYSALPTGDLFQYAVADLKTPDGALIEGSGVEPDVPVRTTRADLADGWDPVYAAARAWLLYAMKAEGAP
ncbi:MAG TPA: TonB family protein [Opitutaceae bacterium]|jgi:carboxyl-terminal processing protease